MFQAMRNGQVQVRKSGCRFDDSIFHTPASAMLALEDYLTGRYGSVTEYLRTAGVTDGVLEDIRRKFVAY